MTDTQFMQSKRRKIQKIFPDAKIKQYKKCFSFRVHGVGHGTGQQLNSVLDIGDGVTIKKMKTMSAPFTPYLYIVF